MKNGSKSENGEKGVSTVTKTKSVYETDLAINCAKTLTLSADERKWIAEALARAVSNEVDTLPLVLLMNKIVSDT